MMSLMPSPAIASTGSAQKGWIMFAVCSPIAVAMAVSAGSTRRFTAAGTMKGPCTAQWPPPDGTNRLMMFEEMKDQNGSVRCVENATKASAMTAARPVPVIMHIMDRPPMKDEAQHQRDEDHAVDVEVEATRDNDIRLIGDAHGDKKQCEQRCIFQHAGEIRGPRFAFGWRVLALQELGVDAFHLRFAGRNGDEHQRDQPEDEDGRNQIVGG